MMKAVFALVLAACVVPALLQGPPGGNLDPTSCAGQGYYLPKGPCKDFVAYFQKHSSEAYTDQATFQTLVNGAPSPSSDCCKAAGYFVGKSCPCDQELLANSGRLNLSKDAIYAVNRAFPISPCHGTCPANCPANAGLSS